MRHFLAVASLVVLAGCASGFGISENDPSRDGLAQFLTGLPGDGPIFAVTALPQEPQEPGYAGFNNGSPQVAATHAGQVCTLGYQRLADEAAPGEPVGFTVWRVRCNPYRPTL